MSTNLSEPKKLNDFLFIKLGGLLVIVYWLIATIRSTILIENSSFLVNLYNPGIWDLLLRILTVVAVMAISLYLQKQADELQVEKNITENELASLTYLIDVADQAIIALDDELRITSFNKGAAVLTGMKPDDMTYQNVLSALFYPEEHDKVRSLLESITEQVQSENFKLKVRRVGTTYVTLRASKEIDNGKIVSQLLFITDVSELYSQHQTAKTQLKQNPAPLLVLDEKRVISSNPAMAKLLNLSLDQITTTSPTELFATYIDDPDTIHTAITESITNKKPQEVEVKLNNNDETKICIVTLEPDPLNPKSLLAWFRDMTNLVITEEKLSSLALELSEVKLDFEQHTDNCILEKQRLNSQLDQEQEKRLALKTENQVLEEQVNQLEKQLNTQAENLLTIENSNAELQKNNERFESKFAAIELPIFQINDQGMILEVNQAATSLLGLEANTPLHSYLGSEDISKLNVLIQDLEQGKARVTVDMEFQRGQQRNILSCHGVRLTTNNNPILLYGYDITSLYETQKELALTLDHNRFELEDMLNEVEIERERMNAILAGINDGIVITDMYNRVTKMNPAAEDMLGIRLSQAHERPIHLIIRNHEIIDHIQKTVREKLYNHGFTLEIAQAQNEPPLELACNTTVIHDRNLIDQGVIIQLRHPETN